MFKRKSVNLAALLALGALSANAIAQQATQLDRVEITGSSIKRVDAEGALPVITLTRKDIEKTGATSVRDLVQMLPSMQGFTTSGESVNGLGGGTTTASLRNLGEIYTLVLLNGRRVAPFDTGSTVNLEQLPLSAIERVEVLADGASALYGADAIAGVVNFITKQNTETGEIDIRYVAPERAGGKQANFSVSKGFGQMERDGFNVYAAFSFDKEERIRASQRSWSKTGVVPFSTVDGAPLYFFQTSVNGDPPNIEVGDANGEFLDLFNPVLLTTQKCGNNPNSFARGSQCRFDYGATVDLVPESERKNLFLSGQVKLGSNFRAFADVLISDASVKAEFAPPAQPLPMTIGSPLYNKYVLPNLAARGLTPADLAGGYVTYYMRLADAGGRRDDFQSKGQHVVLGVDGTVGDFDIAGSYTRSKTDYAAVNLAGYTSRNRLNQLIDSGAFDPFAQGTAASKAALQSAVLSAKSADVESQLDILSVRASGPLFKMGRKDALLGLGADATKQKFANTPDVIYQGPNAVSPNANDFPVGSDTGLLVSDASRKSYGAFAELILPVLEDLELSAAARYDNFDAISNKYVFTPDLSKVSSGIQGNSADKATYKMSLRYQPMKELMLRASVGTGFRAPTLADIVTPLSQSGVISTQRACPVTAADPLFVGCRSVPTQYTLYKGGNSFTGATGLQPETSDQWTAGFRWEPSSEFTAGFDLWSVKIKNAITTVPEDTAFDNFATYRGLFSVTTDAATGRPTLTYNQVSVNSASRVAKGIDWDITLRNKFAIGALTTRFNGTYLIDSYFDLGFGGGKESSLGKIGSDDQVAARVLARVQTTLDSGMFSNTLTMNYRPGYLDQRYTEEDATVFVRNPNGSRGAAVGINNHQVPSYVTLDWQGVVRPMKGLSITIGVKNLLDKEPPFTIKTVAGNQLGVDSRYHDVVGRTYYLQGNYKF